MPVPSALLGLPQIAGTDSPDIPRDLNAVISRFETLRNAFATRQILDVGMPGQIRAGRPLTVADFTSQGLVTPPLLANLSILAGAGSNLGSGGNLVNKGAVPSAPGIMGAAAEAAQFVGAAAQALYLADVGGADPLRIRTGSWGCWQWTPKRGVAQDPIGKWGAVAGQHVFALQVNPSNNAVVFVASDGSVNVPATGISDVADGRWHHIIATHDGTRVRLYVDGAMEASAVAAFLLFSGSAPFNIGGVGSDAATSGISQHYGRVDEVFVTPDVLSEDQIRYLYCASLLHTLPVLPQRVSLLVRRQKRGAPLAAADFPSAPARVYNDATDLSANGANLVANPGTGTIVRCAGPDGSADGAWSFAGANGGMQASDVGMPSGLGPRTHGIWFKSTAIGTGGTMYSWGADERLQVSAANAYFSYNTGDSITVSINVFDGTWHHGVVVEDNAASDGVKRKLYLDGRIVGGSTVLNAVTVVPTATAGLRIGANSGPAGGGGGFIGQLGRFFAIPVALTPEQVRALYLKGTQALGASPKATEDHIEALEATRILATFDALEQSDQVDLVVTV